MAAIVHELALLDDHIATEHKLVRAGLPAPIEALDIVVAHHTLAHVQIVSARGTEADLSVVVEEAAADDQVPGGKRRSAGIRRLEATVFDHPVIAHKLDRAVLSHVGRIAKVEAPQMNMLPLHMPE